MLYPINRNVSLGGKLIVTSGYDILNKNHGLKYGLMFASKFSITPRTSLNISLAPKVNNNAGFVFASIGVRF